jgi:aminocarboxymuconate-semialdehyde decarboxylase
MTPVRPSGVVDAHTHIVLEDAFSGQWALDPALAELREVGGRRRVFLRGRELASVVGEFLDPSRMLAEAGADGVDHLLLAPWVHLAPMGIPAAEARGRCEVLHAALARIVAADPEHLSAVGAVPIDYPDEAAAVLRDACDAGLSGVEVAADSANYLGEESLEPFWDAAESLQAVVFVHPSTRGITLPALDDFYLWNTVGNPAETAIAGAHMALGGVLERHPGLRVLLAHGGGVLPAVCGRLGHGQAAVAAARGRLARPVEESLARFYFDTVTHDGRQLRRLIEDFGHDHVLLGSDRPFDMGDPQAVALVRDLGLDPAAEAAVLGGNAARLIARR